jgi:hypothetical protein
MRTGKEMSDSYVIWLVSTAQVTQRKTLKKLMHGEEFMD